MNADGGHNAGAGEILTGLVEVAVYWRAPFGNRSGFKLRLLWVADSA